MQAVSYTGGIIDRVSELRKDPVWMGLQQNHPQRILLPVWRSLHLISTSSQSTPVAIRLQAPQARHRLADENATVLLGLEGEVPVFAIDISEPGDEQPPVLLAGTQWQDLRQCGPLLSARDAGLLAYARAMIHWHRTQLFCGHCGAKTRASQSGHIRRCVNSDCTQEWFPRTDPAVIMRIEYQSINPETPLILLGRQFSWPEGAYSVLAGFVDPGESLEQAVAREVYEEAGIRIADITYMGSQPWPFPASLMLGFKARALDLDLNYSNHELQHAAWFTAEQLLGFGEWGDSGRGPKLPRPDSISRCLIDDWLHELKFDTD